MKAVEAKVDFYMKTPYDKVAKIYTKYFGHMTKKTAMPIYGKTSSPEPESR